MAYNNGFPINYPYYQQPQPMQVQPMQYQQPQPMPQQVQQMQPTSPQTVNSLIWVQGEAGAKSHFVAPNTTVPLWDSEAQRIFLKSADAAGMPSMKILNYTIEETPNINSPAQRVVNAHVSPSSAPTQEYAAKADQDALRAEIAGYKAEIDKMRSELEAFRGDLYGIAGKKTTSKKKEDVSDE